MNSKGDVLAMVNAVKGGGDQIVKMLGLLCGEYVCAG